jgi:cobalamin biosynthesis protein CobT
MERTLSKASCDANFTYQYNNVTEGMGATRANLLRVLRSLDLVGWSSHEESGKVDRKAFARFAAGSTTVFKRREYAEAERSAVSILIDCSGSMAWDGGRIKIAESVAIQLSRILDKANVDFAVTGFNGGEHHIRANATGANATRNCVKGESLNWIPFKTWGESLRKASSKLGSIRHWTGSSTPDYSALSAAIDDISRRPESRKILFLLTDADGYNRQHIAHLQNIAKRCGVVIVAIGIGSADVEEVFDHAATVNDTRELASTAFNTLLKSLRR